MKTVCTIFFVLLFFGGNLFAQKLFTYDFKEKKMKAPEGFDGYVKEGELISLKVTNINMLLMKVDLEKNAVTYNTKVPDFSLSGLSALTLFSSVTNGEKFFVANDKVHVFKQELPDYYEQFFNLYDQLVTDAKKSASELNIQNQWYPDSNPLKSLTPMDITNLTNDLKDLNKLYFQIILDPDPANKPLKEEVKAQKLKLDEIDLLDWYTKRNVYIDNIQKSTIHFYQSQPKKASGDEFSLSLIISPKDTSKSYPFGVETPVVSMKVIRRHRVTFSTGLFGSSLSNEKFINKPNYVTDINTQVDTVASYTLSKEGTDNYTVGLAAFMHYTWHYEYNYGTGFSIGVGYDLDKNVQYLLGGTLVLGAKNRVIFSGGLSFAQKEQLSRGFKLETTSNAPIDFKTVKKIETGAFISFSYNLNL